MADAVAWQRYTGGVRPVELKQGIQEASVAHPEHVEARSEVGEATETRFDGHSGHGGANFDDGDCGGGNGQSTGHKAPRHRGEAKARVRNSRGSP